MASASVLGVSVVPGGQGLPSKSRRSATAGRAPRAAPVLQATRTADAATAFLNDAGNKFKQCVDSLGKGALAFGAASVLTLSAPGVCFAEDSGVTGSKMVYMNFIVNEKKTGRVVIELYGDAAPAGTERFYDLAATKEGVGYRRTKIATVGQGYITSEPLRSLVYGSGESPITGGDSVVDLEEALPKQKYSHAQPGTVSLYVKSTEPITRSEKLVAINGQLVTVVSEDGEAPNGTAFAITTAPSPGLDASNLVVGHVVEGMEVINEIEAIPAVKENSGSAFFKAAKAAGDKRATVAEKGFNRPFARVAVLNSGVVN